MTTVDTSQGLISISIDWSDVAKKLGPKAMEKASKGGMEESLAFMKREVLERMPVDVGTLRAGVFTEIHGTGVAISGKVAPSPATSTYASVMEWGRRPNSRMPPVAVIARWLSHKGINANAFVVARSIGKKGIAGRHMFELAAKDGHTKVEQIFARWFGNLS